MKIPEGYTDTQVELARGDDYRIVTVCGYVRRSGVEDVRVLEPGVELTLAEYEQAVADLVWVAEERYESAREAAMEARFDMAREEA